MLQQEGGGLLRLACQERSKTPAGKAKREGKTILGKKGNRHTRAQCMHVLLVRLLDHGLLA